MSGNGSWAPIVFLALIGSVTLIPIIFPEISTPVALWIQENVHRFGAWGPLALIALMVLATIFSPIPNSLITLAIGATYGPFWGSIIAVVGAFLAASLAFFLSKKFGSSFVEKYIPHTHMIHDFFRDNAFFTIFILRMIPSVSFDMVSYGAGLTSMVYRTFALATLLGILPGTISIVLVGAGLTFDSGLSWIGIGLYAILIIGGVILAQRMHVYNGETKSEPVKEKRKGIQKRKK
jgi:uncharacterized membrane protein YdjX (TVP38/TMEM64 family)